MPAGMDGWEQLVRDRLEGLRAEARDERFARAARTSRSSSPGRTNTMNRVVRQLVAGTTGGNDR